MKGFVFDLDGTMIDNMMIHHRAWQQKLAELGIDMSLEEVMEKIHGVNVEILERLFGDRFTPEQRVQISQEKEAAYRRIFAPQLQLMPGLQAFLEEARAAGIPMAIGTAAPPDNANFVVDQLGIRDYFAGVFHAGDVSRGKPDPQVFELAAESMQLNLSDCLVFEDSPTGAEAARRGGAKAVILTTTHHPEEFSHLPHIQKFMADYQDFSPQQALAF
ncbi:MAG: HAD family phosphatase [Bacteroidota bacterium]